MLNPLLAKGYPALIYQQLITLPGVAVNNNIIGTKLQEQVGLIYGISININGVDPNNAAVINAADAARLYLVLKQGSSNFIDTYRLDNLVFVDSASNNWNNQTRFLPVNITDKISLDQSYITNPAGIVNKSIILNFHYITKNDYARVKASGLLAF